MLTKMPVEIFSVMWFFMDPFTWLIMRHVCKFFAENSQIFYVDGPGQKFLNKFIPRINALDVFGDGTDIPHFTALVATQHIGFICTRYLTNFALLSWAMYNSNTIKPSARLMKTIAMYGNKTLIEKALGAGCDRECEWDLLKNCTYLAAAHGNYEYLKYVEKFGDLRKLYNTEALSITIENNFYLCFEILFNNNTENFRYTSDILLSKVIELDRVHFLILFCSCINIPIDCLHIGYAVACKSHKCLEYLLCLKSAYDHGEECPKSHKNLHLNCITDNVSKYAVTNNDLVSLKLICKYGYKLSQDGLIEAAELGYLECMQYLIESRVEWSFSVAILAAMCGHVECFSYCFFNDCPIIEEASVYAARNGHLNCLEFMKLYQCPMANKTRLLEEAVSANQFECIEFLKK